MKPTAESTYAEDRSDGDDSLGAAEKSAACGRYLEAIDALTAANRVQRDAAVERRLARLRHEAFREIESADGDQRVAAAADPFPGVEGLIEVSATSLEPELVGATVLHHGCILVRDVLPPTAVAQLVADTDRAFDAYEAWLAQQGQGGPDSTTFSSPWFEPFRTDPRYDLDYLAYARLKRELDRVLLADSPPALFDTLEAFDSAGVRDIARYHLGQRPAFALNKFLLRRIDYRPGVLGWHQDAAAFRSPCRTLNCWTALSECGIDAPGLEIFPTRVDRVLRRAGTGPRQLRLADDVFADFPGVTPIAPVFAPGDALIFDFLLPHRTMMHEGMTKTRYGIEAWFLASKGFPLKDGPMVY